MSNAANVMSGSPRVGFVCALGWWNDIRGAGRRRVKNLKGGPLSQQPAPLIAVFHGPRGLAQV